MQRVLQAIRPRLYLETPSNPVRRVMFQCVKHPAFEIVIMVCIGVNTFCMMLEHDEQSATYVCLLIPRVTAKGCMPTFCV